MFSSAESKVPKAADDIQSEYDSYNETPPPPHDSQWEYDSDVETPPQRPTEEAFKNPLLRVAPITTLSSNTTTKLSDSNNSSGRGRGFERLAGGVVGARGWVVG